MRITNAQINAMMSAAMNNNQAKLAKLMQQMASNKRIQLPSDDPVASVRILRTQREEASLAQYTTNIDTVSSSLSIQEENLTALSDTLLNTRDLLLWAANTGANASDDLAAIAGELESLEGTILSFLNVRDEEGNYLFSGTLSDIRTVNFDPVTETYGVAGNDQHRQIAVAAGVLIPQNVTAAEIFGGNVQLLNELHALVNELKSPTLDSGDPAVRARITATLDELDKAHRGVLGAITELGGRQNTLSLLRESNQQVSLVNQKIEGDLSLLDYSVATVDLSNYKLALEASQKTYLTINNLSLFGLS